MNDARPRTKRALSVAATLAAIVASSACASGAGPRVSDTVPRHVSGGQGAFLMIEGSGFGRGAVVSVGTRRLDQVTWVNGRVLTAQVPGGLPAGTYDIAVSNPGSGQSTLAQALTVDGDTAGSRAVSATQPA